MSQPAGQQQIPVGWVHDVQVRLGMKGHLLSALAPCVVGDSFPLTSIVGLAAACLMAGLYCCRSEYETQFNTAVIYGYSMINTILFSQLFFPEEMPQKSMYLVSCGGAVLYIITGILIIVETDSLSDSDDLRIFITSILCLANGAVFMFEFIALMTKPEMLD